MIISRMGRRGMRIMLFLLSMSFFVNVEAGQIPDLKFKRLDTRDGLTSSQVNCILRDAKGFVWLCTPFGLCRYDGYRINPYFSFSGDSTTLKANRIDDIQEGPDGRLWINHGLSYSIFDPVTGKVDRNPNQWLANHGIEGTLESIHIDSKKNYWVKTYDNGFYFYNPKVRKPRRMNFGYGMDEFPKEFGVSAFSETKDAMIMVSKQGELLWVSGEHGLILKRDDYVSHRLNAFNDYWVYDDPEADLLWVVTHSVGTYIYNTKTKHWCSNLTEFMRENGFENVPEDVVVWEVCRDRKGLLWVATDHYGLFVLDFKNHEWRQFLNDKNDNTTLPESTIKHLYEDALGRMWMTTFKNGIALSSDAMTNFSNLPLGDINAITEDKQGYYWLGMNTGGIKKIDPTTMEVIEEYHKQDIGALNDVVVHAYTASDGTLWFGTWEGGAISYKNGQWKNYLFTDPGSAMVSNNVWGTVEDQWGNIWLGMLGGGAVRIDKHTGKQRAFTDQNSALKTVWTNSINRTPYGWILLGNSEYCAMINPATNRIINLPLPEIEKSFTISSATAHAIMDSRGLIWQCSPSGVVVSDVKKRRSTLLDMKSGFYGSNAVSIVEDDRHTIWVVTDHGISNITPQEDKTNDWWTFAVRSFNDRDGLQPGPFNQRAIYFTSNGLILVGGQDGLDVINTRNLGQSGYKEKPVFSGLLLYEREVEVEEEVGGSVILRKVLNETDGITLRYNDQFTIQLGSTAGIIKNGKRFVYRLDGFNEDWVKTPDNYPNITYNSLRAGTYTLCVRMLNDDGTIGEEESTLEITIRPPLWRTRWAVLLYMFIIALIAFLWRRWFLKKHGEKIELTNLRHQTERKQLMNEVKAMLRKKGEEAEVEEVSPREPIKVEKATHDFVAFVRQQCESFKTTEDKRVKISFNSTMDRLDMLYDEEQMGKMLGILFNNAVRFSSSNCKIQVTVLKPKSTDIKLLIADNGIGVRDEFKEHMFDTFIDEEEGIGLDAVKEIVEAHNGTIKAEDNPGGGTVFVISLPLDEIEEAEIIE